MGCFYLSWIIVSAAALSVLCQDVNLTTSLPEGNDACTRNEVNFTCTIRGSASLTRLILVWRSDEYIGNALKLQFTTADDLGMNIPSMVNENVTATLINNTVIDGVPVLVSKLRIVFANQDSTITCISETATRSNSTVFIVPVFPNSPQNVTARQVSLDCDLSLTWNPPANTDINGLTYKIYVPSRDIEMDVSDTNHVFNVKNCLDDNVRVLVAAVNRFGCEGRNSSAVQPILLTVQLGPGAIAGIVVAVVVMVVVGGVVLLVVVAVQVSKKQEQEKEQIIAEQERRKEQLWVESYCVKVFDGLKWGVHPSALVQESMLQSLEEMSTTSVQKGLISFIDNNLKSATCIWIVLHRLKKMDLPIRLTFDTELEKVESSVTMDGLIKEAGKGKQGELEALLEELREKLCKAKPKGVKELLQKLFEELRNAEEKRGDLQLWIKTYCAEVFDGLERGTHPSELVQESMLKLLKKTSATSVQEGLISFINDKLTSATHISIVLRRLRKMHLLVMSTFDTELEKVESSVTMDRLIEEANKGEQGELTEKSKTLLEELTEKVHKANPERVKELLQNLFKELKNVEKEKDELKDVIDKLEKMKMKAGVSYKTVENRLGKAIMLLKDENFIKEWKGVIQPSIQEIVMKFGISVESLRKVERLLTAELVKGLKREGDDVKVKMLSTCVHNMPDGTEEGEFLVVNLGVSYLQVLHINIHMGEIEEDTEKFPIDESTKDSSHEDLLNFVAEHVAKFMKDKNITKKLPMGFVFPLPVKQESPSSGRIIHWGNFKTTGGVGKDIVQLLKDAFNRQKVSNVHVVALVNDTTAIQLAGIQQLAVGKKVPDCSIGLTLGEGTNACYLESLDAVPKFKGDRKCVIINTEWGAFGDDDKLDQWRTDYDCQLDKNSANPEQQLFEKMISGMYLGEIVRLVLKDLISNNQLFGGKLSTKFDTAGAFSTKSLCAIDDGAIDECKMLFKDDFSIKASDQDCGVVHRVCEAVSTRAARLAAAGVVALVKMTGKISGCTVAVDGFLYEHPKFAKRMKAAMDELAPSNNIKMKLIENGPGRGAAIAAAMDYHLVFPSPEHYAQSASMKGQPENTGSAPVSMVNPLAMMNPEDKKHTDDGVHPLAVNIELEEVPLSTV